MVKADFVIRVGIEKSQHLVQDILKKAKEIRVIKENGTAIIKADKLEVDEALSTKLALLYPDAEISMISDGDEEKFEPDLPASVRGILSCPNQNCVSSQPKEPVIPEFVVISRRPPLLLCVYCGRYLHQAREELFNVTKKIPS
jgi:aspartate carbamoyltransferase regulatory subunit